MGDAKLLLQLLFWLSELTELLEVVLSWYISVTILRMNEAEGDAAQYVSAVCSAHSHLYFHCETYLRPCYLSMLNVSTCQLQISCTVLPF
jgi:hypothetical protein